MNGKLQFNTEIYPNKELVASCSVCGKEIRRVTWEYFGEHSTAEQVRWLDEVCPICGNRVNSWDKRLSKASGYKQIVCEKCIAKEYDITVEELRDTAAHHFGLFPCMGI